MARAARRSRARRAEVRHTSRHRASACDRRAGGGAGWVECALCGVVRGTAATRHGAVCVGLSPMDEREARVRSAAARRSRDHELEIAHRRARRAACVCRRVRGRAAPPLRVVPVLARVQVPPRGASVGRVKLRPRGLDHRPARPAPRQGQRRATPADHYKYILRCMQQHYLLCTILRSIRTGRAHRCRDSTGSAVAVPSQRRTACRADSRCRTVPGLRCPAPREKARATIYALVRATRQHGGAAGGGRSGWCHCVVLRLGLQ